MALHYNEFSDVHRHVFALIVDFKRAIVWAQDKGYSREEIQEEVCEILFGLENEVLGIEERSATHRDLSE